MRRSRNRKQAHPLESDRTGGEPAPAGSDIKWLILVIAIVPLTALSLAVFTSSADSSALSSSVAKTPNHPFSHVNTFSVPPAGPAATRITSYQEELNIPLADLRGGQARFFEHLLPDGSVVRFFAVQTPVGPYEAALDGCASCYAAGQGYVQHGADMVCRKCGRKTPLAQIGKASGDCHPLLIPRTISADHLVIRIKDLEESRRRAGNGAGPFSSAMEQFSSPNPQKIPGRFSESDLQVGT